MVLTLSRQLVTLTGTGKAVRVFLVTLHLGKFLTFVPYICYLSASFLDLCVSDDIFPLIQI